MEAATLAVFLKQLAARLEHPSPQDLTEVRAALRGVADDLVVSPSALTVPQCRQTYAVVDAGRIACPKCQQILVFTRHQPEVYDYVTGRLTCKVCQRKYTLGMLLWRTRSGTRARPHVDQLLSVKQAAQLRQQGYYTDVVSRDNDPVNRYLDGECCCEPFPWRAECPIHGLGDSPP